MTTPVLSTLGPVVVDNAGVLGETSETFDLPKYYGGAKLHFGNITGLTGTLSASWAKDANGVDVFTNILSVMQDGTLVAAGGTVTAADDAELFFLPLGADKVKFTTAAGSGPISLIYGFGADEIQAVLLRKMVLSGLSASLGSEKADDAPFTPGTSTVVPIGAMADETAADSVDEGDVGIPRMTLDRLLHAVAQLESNTMRTAGVSATVKFAAITATGAGDNQVVALVASRKIRVLSYVLVADAAEVVQWQDGAGTNLSGTMSLAANGGIVAPFNPGGWFETAAGQRLDLNNVGGVDVDGHLSYIEVP